MWNEFNFDSYEWPDSNDTSRIVVMREEAEKTRKETDLAISGLVNSLQLLKQGLSAKKRRIISEYVKTGNQSLAAENLNMTQQGVSKALKSSNWREIKDGERKLQRALEIYSDRLGRKQRSLDDFY